MQKEKQIVTKGIEKNMNILLFLTKSNPSRKGLEVDRRGPCKMCFCMHKNLLIVPGRGLLIFFENFCENNHYTV